MNHYYVLGGQSKGLSRRARCSPGSAVGGQILLGLPVNVVDTAESGLPDDASSV